MTASPETGPVVLLYGCTECNWIYPPQTPEETSETYLLMAQFKFEQVQQKLDDVKRMTRAEQLRFFEYSRNFFDT